VRWSGGVASRALSLNAVARDERPFENFPGAVELSRQADGLQRMGTRANAKSSRPVRVVAAVASMIAAQLLVVAVPAWAHLEPSPSEVRPGKETTVTFTVAHGCSGSPTKKVSMKLPSGIIKPVVTGPKGWTATISGGTATFAGPPIAATKKTSITVRFTAPNRKGILVFPAVQYCVKGSTAWIEPTPPAGDEPDHPAPIVTVTAG
jgi:periplasmic copper chaperone A